MQDIIKEDDQESFTNSTKVLSEGCIMNFTGKNKLERVHNNEIEDKFFMESVKFFEKDVNVLEESNIYLSERNVSIKKYNEDFVKQDLDDFLLKNIYY